MANQNFRPPRSLFGFGPQPLPGSQNPMVSSTMQDRFNQAGLQSYLPYLDPWSTVAQAQDYRNFERDLNRQEQIATAEDRFLQAVQEDPQTGYERFLQQNPLAVMSPMVRAYAVTRDRMRNEPKQDRLAVETAQLGSPYLSTYEKGRSAGKSDIQAYADAVSQYNKDQAEAKKSPPEHWTKRLSDKEREVVRSEVQTAMAPSDFETEFNDVLKKNPGLTRDAYVKQFKGDPDYASYQLRRAMESGVPQRLIREYGLTQNEVASLFGVAPPEKSAPAAPEPLPSPGVPQPPPGPQNAPQAPPVPQEQPPAANAIPSYKYRLNQTPMDSIMRGAEQAAPVIGNLASNLMTDPLGKIGDVALGRGMEVIGEATLPPSQERDNAKWNAAKTSMMEYLNSLGKSPQEVEELLGSILRGERLPIAVFLKEGATRDDEGRLTASTALGQAFRRANKTAAGSALTDSSGSHGWETVARALAQEYFTRKGVIAPTNNSAPAGSASSSAPIPVSSLDDIRKLPIGASFTYKGQTRVKTSEVK